MTKWLARQEAVDQFNAYLDWTLKSLVGSDDEQNDTDHYGGNAETEEPECKQHGDAEIEEHECEKQQPNRDTTLSKPATHVLAI